MTTTQRWLPEPDRERALPADGSVRRGPAAPTPSAGQQSVMGNQRFLERLKRREDGREPLAERAQGDGSALDALILPDVGPQGVAGGMRKRAFLELLESEVTRAAERELNGTGRSTEGCPWIAYWFRYYERRDTAHLARAIEKYAPEAARAESPEHAVALVRDRVRDGVRRSLRSGTIEDLPPGIPLEAFAPGSEASVPVGEPSTDPFGLTPEPVRGDTPAPTTESPAEAGRAELGLGAGTPLDTRTRSRMESAFRTDLSDVRLHADAAGQTAASRRNAQAFAYGSDIAMGAGDRRMGTPVGDALLAHEIAHVLQQRPARRKAEPTVPGSARSETAAATSPPTSAATAPRSISAPGPSPERSSAPTASAPLEADADRSAAGAMGSLWGGGARGDDAVVPLARTSALRVSSCGGADDPNAIKTVRLKPIRTFESTGDPAADVAFGNANVYPTAKLQLAADPESTLDEAQTNRLIGTDRSLAVASSGQSTEEQRLVSDLGSDEVIPIVYVKDVASPDATMNRNAEQIPGSCGRTAIAIENGTVEQGLSHEVGHALGLEHREGEENNLMNPLLANTHVDLDATQVSTMRRSPFAR